MRRWWKKGGEERENWERRVDEELKKGKHRGSLKNKQQTKNFVCVCCLCRFSNCISKQLNALMWVRLVHLHCGWLEVKSSCEMMLEGSSTGGTMWIFFNLIIVLYIKCLYLFKQLHIAKLANTQIGCSDGCSYCCQLFLFVAILIHARRIDQWFSNLLPKATQRASQTAKAHL